jgi:hypothetical protein
MRRWVCADWYWDIDHFHVAVDDAKPRLCHFKALVPIPNADIHTEQCGVMDITMTAVKEDANGS